MGRRIAIPGLADVLLVDAPGEIRDLAGDARLRRGGPPAGRWLTRRIQANALGAMRAGDHALPSALPEDDAGRREAQAALADRLDPAAAPWDGDSLQAIADYLRGDRSRTLGALAQEAVGRLFKPDYRATRETWRAAVQMDRAARSLNPARRLAWRATRRTEKAQAVLAEAVGGDPAGIHATGIAVHTFLRSVRNLDAALAEPRGRRFRSTSAMLGRALAAPTAVLRVATDYADTAAGPVAPGTLVVMQLDAATGRTSDPRVAFMAGSWSACPADRVVTAMLAEIWQRATGESR